MLPKVVAAGQRELLDTPGIRTLRSSRFRVVLAATLLGIGVVLIVGLLARQAADPSGQYGIDFKDWYQGAVDIYAGRSPYPDRYIHGPVPVTDFGYRYPPTFAQTLVPLTSVSLTAATHIWAAIQAGAAFLAVWIGGLLGGARRTVEHFLWSGVAAAFYLPFFDTVWKGNVSAIQALQIALVLAGGSVAGTALASAVLLKTTPLALVPPAVAHGGRLLRALFLSGVVVVVLSVVAAPQAWVDYVRIQPNLLTGPYVVSYNLQPANMAALALPDVPAVASALRIVTVLGGVAAIAAAVVLARRAGKWPAAVLLGTVAIIVIPGAIWYHYLAMLLPTAAFAWPRASRAGRLALGGGAACVTIGVAWLPLALAGGIVLATATLSELLGADRRSAVE